MLQSCVRTLLVLALVTCSVHAKAQSPSQSRPYLLAFSCLPTSSPYYSGLHANLANIDGCVDAVDWSSIELTKGSYTWGALDNDTNFAPYVGETCGGNLGPAHSCYLVPVIRLVSNTNGYNTSTPSYVYGSGWATHVGAPHALDYAWCSTYEGDKTGSGTADAGDSTTFPAVWELPFSVASENFIAALISHLNGLNTGIGPQILYVRIGYTAGGEAFPICESQLQTIANVTRAQDLFTNYFVPGYAAEALFIKNQSPKMQMEMSVNCGNNLAWCPYNSLPESGDLQADGLGIGNQGLQVGDGSAITNGQETSNGWYADYTTHPNSHWREMQTLKQSCPTGTPPSDCTSEMVQTGSLTDIFPFLTQYANLNSLELYTDDILCTYDSSYNPSGSPTYADCQAAGYPAAFRSYF